jgi:hypothetical protein
MHDYFSIMLNVVNQIRKFGENLSVLSINLTFVHDKVHLVLLSAKSINKSIIKQHQGLWMYF